MKEIIAKYSFILLITLSIIVPGSIFMIGFSGCATVQYEKSTPSAKCNLIIMLIKLKEQEGLKAFEISKYLEECFDDLEMIKEE